MASENVSVPHLDPEKGPAAVDEAENDGSQPQSTLHEEVASLKLSGHSTEAKSDALYMQQRCQQILSEVEQFQSHLRKLKKDTGVESRVFKTGLQAEMRLLDKVNINYVSTGP